MTNRYFRRDCPDPKAVESVRCLAADTSPHYALRAALQAAGNRGEYIIEQTRNHRGPALDRTLVVLQSAIEELEGIAAALAAGETPGDAAAR
jgi:hypothetical protein